MEGMGKRIHRRKETSTMMLCVALLLSSACSRPDWNSELPDATTLGNPQGYRIARSILHLHSPYSHDACDKKGWVDGQIDQDCLSDLRRALCLNRIDAAFLSDHPEHMAESSFQDLLLNREGDSWELRSGVPRSNRVAGCSNGHQPLVSAGFEGRVMALGMDNHALGSVADREALYGSEDSASNDRVRSETGALVMIPHTESRSAALLQALRPDGIEVYNFHANLDPKIRKASLGFPQFDSVLDILPYWVDPYGDEEPDLAFLSFFQISPIYAEKWDGMIQAGLKPTGFAGNDSHQNTLPYRASDGERLDSHRRLLRWFTNHLMVTDLRLDSLRDALLQGRAWMVAEGLGTPVGVNFRAESSGTEYPVGSTLTFVPGATRILSALPTLHPGSPQKGSSPILTQRLYWTSSSASSQLVATAVDQDLEFYPTERGAYRLEISTVPRHLKPWVRTDRDRLKQEYPWIVTNPVYLE